MLIYSKEEWEKVLLVKALYRKIWQRVYLFIYRYFDITSKEDFISSF